MTFAIAMLVVATTLAASAQGGIPAETEACRTWTKMNAAALTDPSNPRANRPDPLPVRAPGSGDRVEIFNYQFGPQALRVRTGATVTWVNYDGIVHDIKAANRSFESGNLAAQGRFFFTFDRPGTIEYFCAVHLEMRGRVVVEP